MDKTQDKMNIVTKKLSALLKTSDAGTLYTIMMLSLILLVLVFLVIVTWEQERETRAYYWMINYIDNSSWNY